MRPTKRSGPHREEGAASKTEVATAVPAIVPDDSANGGYPGHLTPEPCESCGQQPATTIVGFGPGGHLFEVCASCAHEAIGRGAVSREAEAWRCESCDEAAWLVVRDAEGIIGVEDRAVEACRALPPEALPSLKWVGPMDHPWVLKNDELTRRGESQ